MYQDIEQKFKSMGCFGFGMTYVWLTSKTHPTTLKMTKDGEQQKDNNDNKEQHNGNKPFGVENAC
jgi:hypothetical protein